MCKTLSRQTIQATALAVCALAAPALAGDFDGPEYQNGWSYDGPQAGADGVLVINGCRIEPETQCPGADLRHADLSGQNLFRANFRGALLSRAKFNDANVKFANFDGADLTGASFEAAFMQGSTARGADMRAVNLDYARVSAADWSGADLRAATMEMMRANKIQLKGAMLQGADLMEAKLYDANLQDAVMDEGTRITFAIFEGTFMEGCRGCPFDW